MNDTHPEAERVQIELLRRAGPRRRALIGSNLTNNCKWLARRAIERAHPEMSERDRALLFIDVHYGREWAERIRAAWAARTP